MRVNLDDPRIAAASRTPRNGRAASERAIENRGRWVILRTITMSTGIDQNEAPLVEMRGIGKSFPGVRALDQKKLLIDGFIIDKANVDKYLQ